MRKCIAIAIIVALAKRLEATTDMTMSLDSTRCELGLRVRAPLAAAVPYAFGKAGLEARLGSGSLFPASPNGGSPPDMPRSVDSHSWLATLGAGVELGAVRGFSMFIEAGAMLRRNRGANDVTSHLVIGVGKRW